MEQIALDLKNVSSLNVFLKKLKLYYIHQSTHKFIYCKHTGVFTPLTLLFFSFFFWCFIFNQIIIKFFFKVFYFLFYCLFFLINIIIFFQNYYLQISSSDYIYYCSNPINYYDTEDPYKTWGPPGFFSLLMVGFGRSPTHRTYM